MPLSDRERRLLAEMEEALATDDPRLQSRLAGATMTRGLIKGKPRILLGVSLIFAGIAVLFAGLISQVTLIGVAGFLIALTGLLALIRSIGNPAERGVRVKGPRRDISSRLQERWDKRNPQQ